MSLIKQIILSYKNPSGIARPISIKNLELTLVILSSFLMGIWAVKETVALRNILLVCGTLFSIYYIVQEWLHGDLKEYFTIWKALPILLLVLTFAWVCNHYLFFSVDSANQFSELRSTWLRSLMASIIGFATGLALRNHPNRLILLWLGVCIAFVILFIQYIPRAITQKKLLVPDYDHYLFHLKFNTVMMGMLLIAGTKGALLDYFRFIQHRWSNRSIWYLFFYVLSISMVLWAFVYIIDTRNGIGLTFIFFVFWLLLASFNLMRSKRLSSILSGKQFILISGLSLSLIIFFVILQTTVNKSWNALFEDVKIAVQIDRYNHWQNLAQMGYPVREDKSEVSRNTYERVAWAFAGSRAIILYPQGVGLLAYPYEKHPNATSKKEADPKNPRISTHSGWVELGLAFGIPLLSLIFSALLLIFIEAARYEYPARMTVLGFVFMTTFLYTFVELYTDHCVEILFFMLALMPALLLTKPIQIDVNA